MIITYDFDFSKLEWKNIFSKLFAILSQLVLMQKLLVWVITILLHQSWLTMRELIYCKHYKVDIKISFQLALSLNARSPALDVFALSSIMHMCKLLSNEY